MDLGIRGKTAIVCAASKGLGRGCAEALAEAGVDLVINSRTQDVLDRTAEEIRDRFQVKVTAVAADIGTDAGRQAVLSACPNPDILVNNNGGPPAGMWSDWDEATWLKAVNGNMITPILLMNATLPAMMKKGWGRVVNITSMAVKAPIGVLGLSNAARAGLTGFVAGTSRQVAGSGVTINNLLPGVHDTDRSTTMDAAMAKQQGVPVEKIVEGRSAQIPVGRYGTSYEFGQTCAFLCSKQAAFIVGQNILHDGGQVNLSM